MASEKKIFKAGFSLTFVFQESLGLPSVVFESPWTNFKSPMWKHIVSGVKTEGNRELPIILEYLLPL